MRARAGRRKREASRTTVRPKRRGSRQLRRQRHQLQRDQIERQAPPGRFRASFIPESVCGGLLRGLRQCGEVESRRGWDEAAALRLPTNKVLTLSRPRRCPRVIAGAVSLMLITLSCFNSRIPFRWQHHQGTDPDDGRSCSSSPSQEKGPPNGHYPQ
jgi:hypothetical protein